MIADLQTRMREAAADLNFEEAARLRDEIKRLRATELAVVDDPTPRGGGGRDGTGGGTAQRDGAGKGQGSGKAGASHWAGGTSGKSGPDRTVGETSNPAHGAATTAATRIGATGAPSRRDDPHKPNLDQMGPGIEAIPQGKSPGPRSTLGRPGMHGGKPRRR